MSQHQKTASFSTTEGVFSGKEYVGGTPGLINCRLTLLGGVGMMNQTSEVDNALSETSNVLFWCFAMSMVLLLA